MQPGHRHLIRDAVLIVAIVTLPLLGAWLAGQPLREYFLFPPPLRIPPDYPRFSWLVAIAVVGVLLAIALPWLKHSSSPPRPAESAAAPLVRRAFPWWGWAAVVWTGIWWALAWTRFPRFAPLQLLTFFPLWLGFVVVVNALTHRRTGRCLMTRAPRRWLGLFAASAGFWWLFEWLNRFVQNWHYLGVEDFGPAGYALHATLCFSTVLPAVAAVREWLGTLSYWQNGYATGPTWRWLARPGAGVILVAAGLAALFLTGLRPGLAYPALWVAPLAVMLGIQLHDRSGGLAAEIALGDWRRALPWMLAALACGFFWEMWNVPSAAKWIYTVPYADRWHVFEMPLLGYAGYLPFGLECGLVVERIFGRRVL